MKLVVKKIYVYEHVFYAITHTHTQLLVKGPYAFMVRHFCIICISKWYIIRIINTGGCKIYKSQTVGLGL